MLHERIRDQNEVPGDLAAECDRDRSREMATRPESFLTPDQCADERALQEEREHSFHRQRLSYHAAGILRKVCPVRSELEFHPNAGHDSDRKIQPEKLGPKSDGLVVFIIARSEPAPFPVKQETPPPQPARGVQIVINTRAPQ